MSTEDLLRAGRLADVLATLEEQVRADPSDHRLRVFMFQLLLVSGDWERAVTQLNVAAQLEPLNLLMAQVCGAALNCEALRAQVFAGKRTPLIFGEPEQWVGWLLQANQMVADGNSAASRELRERAFDEAPAVPGSIDGHSFQWIADADSRLGPMLEVIVDGKYYWAPFHGIRQVKIEPPKDLRDLVWIPATFTWANGGESVGLIPTRYPDSQNHEDNSIKLARRTEWMECPGAVFVGLGQRMFATDEGEFPLLETRQIELESLKQDA